MKDRISRAEIRKDALQDTVEATATAVGAVKKLRTLCSLMTRQKAAASGVPTGLPS